MGSKGTTMRPSRTWGFRLSSVDIAVILALVPATWMLLQMVGILAWGVPIVFGHFFLFCNVVRIQRWKELVWAGVFLVNAGAWAIGDDFWWAGVLYAQTPVTILLVWSDMRNPRYHGVFARRINPKLEDYLEGRL